MQLIYATFPLIFSLSPAILPTSITPPGEVTAPRNADAQLAPSPAPEPTPSEAFAHAVIERADAGWRVRAIDIQEDVGRVSFAVTMASDKAARTFALNFTADGSSVAGFEQAAAAVPKHKRVYDVEPELIRLLTIAPPTAIDYECGSYYLDGFDGGLSVDPMSYYVTLQRASGAKAPRVLARAIADALADELPLIDVRESETRPDGAARAIELLFDGRVVHIGLSSDDEVRSVDVRRSSVSYVWKTYDKTRQLKRFLRGRSSIQRIQASPTGPANQEVTVTLDGTFTIDLIDFEEGEFECMC